MQNNKFYSLFLVAAQFILIALMVSPARDLWPLDTAGKILGIVLVLDALAIALWALYTLRLKNFSVMPEPRENAVLNTHGPYRFVRHPMYSAVLLAGIGLWLMHATAIKGLVLLILAGVLLAKIKREESLLSSQYTHYAQYRSHTKALIPGVY